MVELCVNVPDELKIEIEESNLDLSSLFKEFIKRELLKQMLLKKLNSKEEQELTKWSVDLGRRAKKGRFKQLLKEVSPEIREKLLSKLSPEKREEYK